MVDGTEGPGSFDELNKLVVASLQPLQTVGASAADDEIDVAGEEGRKYVGMVGTKGGRGGRT